MTSARMSSFVTLLTVCLVLGSGTQWRLEAQPVATHTLQVGEYSSFGFLSLFRLYTDPIFDPAEARSAEVRCFHELNDLTASQRSEAFGQIRAGRMHLASRMDGAYYVVETAPLPHAEVSGVPEMHIFVERFPDSWKIRSDRTPELRSMIHRAADLATSSQPQQPSDRNRYWNELRTVSVDELGVVPNHVMDFSSVPCKRIVNWTGVEETIGHVAVSVEEVSEDLPSPQ